MKNMCLALTQLMIFLLGSCLQQNSAEKEIQFAKLFPDQVMNTEIGFLPVSDSFRIGDCVDLDLQNLSNHKIVFPSDFDT
jgi:hypothetical protein